MDLIEREKCATAQGLWKAAKEIRGLEGKSKMWSLKLYSMVCVMLVCCAEDRGKLQSVAWTLF
jgi:hypothetical protein